MGFSLRHGWTVGSELASMSGADANGRSRHSIGNAWAGCSKRSGVWFMTFLAPAWRGLGWRIACGRLRSPETCKHHHTRGGPRTGKSKRDATEVRKFRGQDLRIKAHGFFRGGSVMGRTGELRPKTRAAGCREKSQGMVRAVVLRRWGSGPSSVEPGKMTQLSSFAASSIRKR